MWMNLYIIFCMQKSRHEGDTSYVAMKDSQRQKAYLMFPGTRRAGNGE